MIDVVIAVGATFLGMLLLEVVVLGLARFFGLYTIVGERTCRVYLLFGKVVGMISEPGLHFLPAVLGSRRSS